MKYNFNLAKPNIDVNRIFWSPRVCWWGIDHGEIGDKTGYEFALKKSPVHSNPHSTGVHAHYYDLKDYLRRDQRLLGRRIFLDARPLTEMITLFCKALEIPSVHADPSLSRFTLVEK